MVKHSSLVVDTATTDTNHKSIMVFSVYKIDFRKAIVGREEIGSSRGEHFGATARNCKAYL